MPDLQGLIDEALDIVWWAGVDAARSPEFADDQSREQYRTTAIADVRDALLLVMGRSGGEPQPGQRVSEHLDLGDPYRWNPGPVILQQEGGSVS